MGHTARRWAACQDRERRALDFPGYSVICEIGRGGMATVYRARQVMLDREVALKVLNPALAAEPVNAQRFLQEARMLASLEHPHVVPVYEVGVTPEGSHYFSMQLLENGDFAARLERGIDQAELVRVLAAVADALGYAHARGYVHRDVTPANILFDAEDNPRLTDFGIARAMSVSSRITASGLSVGTSHYMSPEQARGAEVDPRSDIYSLGVVCYEALTGKPPFEGSDAFAVAYAHVHEQVPPLPARYLVWQPLVDHCLAKNPDERFQDCTQFIDMLRRIAPSLRATSGARRAQASGEHPVPADFSDDAVIAEPSWRQPGLLQADAHAEASAPGRPRWVGPFVALVGLVGILALFAWRPWSTVAPETAMPGPEPALVQEAGLDAGDDGLSAEEAAELAVLASSQGVEDPIRALLLQARRDFAARRYTSPPGNNALQRYRQVQAQEPGNREARAGIERIAQRYLALADEQAGDEDPSLWLGYLQRAGELAVEFGVEDVATGVAERREAWLDRTLKEGEVAIAAWDRERAMLVFERGLALAPDSSALQQGLARARRIGRDGFAFRDTVDGRAGPEMLVVGSLAYGRSPVTLGEFRHYWERVGQGRFGSLPANCRDRESLFRGSRKRTFLDPGFTQGDSHPVVCVTAAMADDYARWLSQMSARAYRVPSSAELAAVGVGSADDCTANGRDAAYRAIHGGRDALGCDDGHAETSPVMAFAPAANGLRDTRGNVREWTSDCVGGACRERLVSGGSWASSVSDGTTRAFPADTGFNTIGFRVVREIP